LNIWPHPPATGGEDLCHWQQCLAGTSGTVGISVARAGVGLKAEPQPVIGGQVRMQQAANRAGTTADRLCTFIHCTMYVIHETRSTVFEAQGVPLNSRHSRVNASQLSACQGGSSREMTMKVLVNRSYYTITKKKHALTSRSTCCACTRIVCLHHPMYATVTMRSLCSF